MLAAAFPSFAKASGFWDAVKKEQKQEQQQGGNSDLQTGFLANSSVCSSIRAQAKNLKKLYEKGGTEAAAIKAMGGANSLKSWEWAYISYVGLYKDSPDVDAEDVAILTYNECMAGRFNEN